MRSWRYKSAVAEIQWLGQCFNVVEEQIKRVDNAIDDITDENDLDRILTELDKVL